MQTDLVAPLNPESAEAEASPPSLGQRLGGGLSLVAAAASLAACGGGHVGTPGPNGVVYDTGLPGSGGSRPEATRDALGTPTRIDAARFLAQATFGPRALADIDAVCDKGYRVWLWEQFNAPTLRHVSYLDWQRQRNEKFSVWADLSYEAVWQQWLQGEDQLRGRVAYALSQIIVVSNIADDLPAYALSSWMDMLNHHAFGNYRDLLGAVTRHTAMGYYLNMQGSRKENTLSGAHPNENYAREILQLFSVGLVRLNADGSTQTANGAAVPAYDETVVRGFARAFTGWTVAHAEQFGQFDESRDDNWREPMKPDASQHEPGTKALLNGTLLPEGGSPQADLDAALDNIFNHPNVGPFIGRQLIQRLVCSNPSAAYIGRVSAAFANNGQGVRGDLRAVVQAVLLDAEARDPALGQDGRWGKLREPVLRLAQLLRALDARNASGANRIHALDSGEQNLGQSPLLAPSVFNFYSPDYKQAGALAAAGLVAPEFQITTETTVVASLNLMAQIVSSDGYGWDDGRLQFDRASWQALSRSGTDLAERINWMLCRGQLSASTRSRLVQLVDALPPGDLYQRLRQGLILAVLSPDFVVQT